MFQPDGARKAEHWNISGGLPALGGIPDVPNVPRAVFRSPEVNEGWRAAGLENPHGGERDPIVARMSDAQLTKLIRAARREGCR